MRLFIGMKIPPELRRSLEEKWKSTPNRPASCRASDPAVWHFTLAFLGEVEPTQLETLDVLLGKAGDKPPKGRFFFESFETFPAKNPSYVVARATPEAKKEWTSFIETLRDIASVAAPQIDRKPWVPHVTIARCKKTPRLPAWRAALEPFYWEPTEFTLVRSEPTSNGSRYTDLHVYPFQKP